MCEKSVLDPIPRTQHRPICVTVSPSIVPQPTISRRRFNLKKLTGTVSTEFQEDVDQTTYLVSLRSLIASMKYITQQSRDMTNYQEVIQRPNQNKPSVSGQCKPSRTSAVCQWLTSGCKQCSANASHIIRSQSFRDNRRLSPY